MTLIENFVGSIHSSTKEFDGKVELVNITEDPDELEMKVNIFSGNSLELIAFKANLVKGTFRDKIREILDQYEVDLRSEFCDDKSMISETRGVTKVTSKTVINSDSKSKPLASQKPIVSKVSSSKKKSRKSQSSSDDLIFYISLLSILGVGAVLAVKLVNRM